MSTPVLYLMANAFPGGAERATMLMLRSHDRRRYTPLVLFFKGGPLVDEARQMGIDARVLSRPTRIRQPWSLWRAVDECRDIVQSSGAGLVHSCMSYAHLIGGAAAARARVGAVLYQHGPVGTWIDGAATLGRCDRIMANSRFTQDEQRRVSWRQRRVTIAPYGVDMSMPPDERRRLASAADASLGLDPAAPVIGMMARFDPWKGIDVAIRAAAPLLRDRPALRFLLVGGQYLDFHPGYESELRALVDREGISEQVIFTGYQMDVRPYLARMTMLIHASVQPEPFGLTIVEAMAAGIPAIVSRAGGAADIIEHEVDGLFHTPGREEELRLAMRRLLDDELLRASIIDGGLRKVAAQYTPARMIDVIEGVYDEVLH